MTRLSRFVRAARANLALAVVVCAGLAPATARAAGSPDEWITTRAKIALWTAGHVDSTAVHVDTNGGQVTLSGKVHSTDQRQIAESVARAIPDVKSVRNLLQIVPESTEKAVNVADAEIKTAAAKALKSDPGLRGTSIKVKSVNKGAVLLSGKAKDLFEYLHALDVVNDVPGVRQLDSEVTSPTRPSKIAVSASTARAAALDDWITTATKLRLLADSSVPALEVSVDTRRGIVTLFGIVPTSLARSAAEFDARQVDGNKGVVNELEVVAKTAKDAVDVKDDVVKESVKAALTGDAAFKNVNVEVKNGVARLTGHVASSWLRLHAAILARSTDGVRSVDDDLILQAS